VPVKNFENRLIFGDDIDKSLLQLTFLGHPVYELTGLPIKLTSLLVAAQTINKKFGLSTKLKQF